MQLLKISRMVVEACLGGHVWRYAPVPFHSGQRPGVVVARRYCGSARSSAGPLSRLRLSAELIKPT
jgi:hypothetical protein